MLTKHHLANAGTEACVHPAERLVTDFTRLIKDVDRLMIDIGNAAEKESTFGEAKINMGKLTLNDSISMLRQHARSFAKSTVQSGLLLDRLPVPYLELDEKARILRTNEEGAKVLNGSSTPFPGKSLFSFVAGSDIKRLREHLAVARQTDKPSSIKLSMVHKGKHRLVGLRIRRQLVGKEIEYAAVVEDADQLRDPHPGPRPKTKDNPPSMHDLVVNLSHVQTVRSMADLVANYCGKAFCKTAGMIFIECNGRLQLVSRWRSEQNPKKNLAEETIKNGPVARAFRTGEPSFWRWERTPQSRVSRYVSSVLRRSHCQGAFFLPISAPGQRPVGVFAVVLQDEKHSLSAMRDEVLRLGQIVAGCTVRTRAYDAALEARVNAENANRRKDEFISVLSHELKNQLVPILGWSVALSSGRLPADKLNHALDGIVRNIRALNYLIEDLFDAARISSGKLRLQPAEIRIQEVAREALATIQPMAEGKKLRISTDISEAIPPFMADSRRLQQVLVNLLNNAVKFTPDGGSINLTVRRHGDHVECIVSDTGRGIERKFLPFIFDRFRQENRRYKVQAAGLGLGLEIVREIVALHNGSIKAISEGPDKGSTFILRLPMRRRHRQNG